MIVNQVPTNPSASYYHVQQFLQAVVCASYHLVYMFYVGKRANVIYSHAFMFDFAVEKEYGYGFDVYNGADSSFNGETTAINHRTEEHAAG